MRARVGCAALIAATLNAGCAMGVSGLGWYTPDTPHNRLYSGYDDPGCEHPTPPIADAFIGGLLAVAAAVVTADRFDDDPLGPAVVLYLPSALFFVSAAGGVYMMGRCRSQQRESDVEEARVAAAAGDCATLRTLAPRIKQLNRDYYETAFVRDAAIARCLGRTEPRFFCTTSSANAYLCFCSQVQSECEERQRSIVAMGAAMSSCAPSLRDCEPAPSNGIGSGGVR